MTLRWLVLACTGFESCLVGFQNRQIIIAIWLVGYGLSPLVGGLIQLGVSR